MEGWEEWKGKRSSESRFSGFKDFQDYNIGCGGDKRLLPGESGLETPPTREGNTYLMPKTLHTQ